MLRHLHLAVLLAFIAFTFAVDLPAGFLHPRQDTPVISGAISSSEVVSPSTSAQPTTQPTTTAAPPTSASPTPQPTTSAAPPPTTTAAPPPSTTAAPPSSSAAPPSSSPTIESQPPSSAASSIPPSSTISDSPSNTLSSLAPDVTVTSTNLAPLDQILTTITFTSDGVLVSSTATSTRTQVPTSSSKPGLASGYGNETNTLSTESKKLIGGIVGGIGGAFLLAGIAFVVYKMWGKKKWHSKVPQEEDYFGGASGAMMSSGSSDSLGKEKKSGWGPSSLTNKFAEPLDRYRSPSNGVTSPVAGSWGGRSPNAASNF